MNTLAQFWRLLANTLKARWPAYLALVGVEAVFGAVFLNIVLAFLIRDAVNASETGNIAFLQRGMALAVGAFIVAWPGAAITFYLSRRVWRDGEVALQTSLFSRVLYAPLYAINAKTAADLQLRTGPDVDLATGIVTDRLRPLAFALMIGGVATVSVFVLALALGVVLVCIGVVQIAVIRLLSRPLANITVQIQEATNALLRNVSEAVSGAAVIRSYGLASVVDKQMRHVSRTWLRSKQRESWVDGGRLASDLLFDSGGALVMLFAGSFLAEAKIINTGALVAAMLLLGNASYLFATINSLIADFQRASVGAQRMLDVMAMPQESLIGMPNGAADNTPITTGETPADTPALVVENLRYRHPGQVQPVINGLNFTVPRNRITVLMGPSGLGKTTLLYLILGLYEGYSGTISVFGKRVSSETLFAIRSSIAFVAQDSPLVRGTVFDNILLGNVHATREQVIEAAKLAQADEFVSEFPRGYDELVGEDGAQLSGGQRQRIAIARAILKPAKLLLLDEPTSGLDVDAERRLKQALRVLAQARTILAVSHRNSFVDADDIVIDMGQRAA